MWYEVWLPDVILINEQCDLSFNGITVICIYISTCSNHDLFLCGFENMNLVSTVILVCNAVFA